MGAVRNTAKGLNGNITKQVASPTDAELAGQSKFVQAVRRFQLRASSAC